jgi:hypothetical protein
VTVPPPPSYAPTAGQTTWWTPEPKAAPAAPSAPQVPAADPDWSAFADRIAAAIAETPEQRRDRAEQARRATETKAETKARHKQAKRDAEHRAAAFYRQHSGERARRVRKWSAVTVLAASVGYAVHLVQLVSSLPFGVGVGALAACWVLDLRLRGWGTVRVADVRGPRSWLLLVAARIPFGSALAAVLHLAPLLAATGRLIHHH